MSLSKVDVFRNLRLAQRLSIGFGVVIVLVLAACIVVGIGLAQLQQQAEAHGLAEAAATARWSFWSLLGLVGLAVVAGGFSAWRVSSSVAEPMNEAMRAAQRVRDGNLVAVPMTRRGDEVGLLLQALDGMRGHLGELVGQVRGHAASVADSSAQIAQGHLDLSQRTERQATALQQTAGAVEQLAGTVGQNADDARQAHALAAGAAEVARQGGSAVGEVVQTMTDIHAASRRIADIVGVIDGIAFQTNILALNAAVEAARAGEQGRGFAVVAAEVRGLAQRSAVAAREIKALIAASVAKVDAGARQVDTAGRTMGEIVAAVQGVSDLVARIAAASQEQRAGIGQVNIAVSHMEQAVQQNASMVEEAAAATDALKDQAGTLFALVTRFQLNAERQEMQPKLAQVHGSTGFAVGNRLIQRA